MKLAKSYEPKQYEDDIYNLWEQSRAFEPKKHGEPYTIVMPPPNANADLHIGHALVIALEDIIIRYQRLKGRVALYVPGADHAGFETWVVYEKQLAKEGKSRFDFTREELYSQVWDFVQLNKTKYDRQIRQIGASCDWSRFAFTLDDKVVNTAYSTFKKMWDKKLIYRDERLVNFCTFHGTAFADIEVEFKELEGKLWYIKYPLTDKSGHITVATTRPETMLGDTAIAVNPKDKKMSEFVGKTVRVPLTNREIPVIADKMVDPKFGTGAVKITPAHDPNDFDVAQRHDLPKISVIDHEGLMTHEVPPVYQRLNYKDAREQIVSDLKDGDYLVDTKPHTHSVGHCYKCGGVIQPLLREQWFVDMKRLAQDAIKVLREDKIKFYPDTKKKQLIEYLKNLRDWNISRQIAWGIPIPAFQNIENPEDWMFDTNVEQEIISVNGKKYRRDPDVFDTWFSSGMWPFVTLNYPDGEDYKRFYPLNLMETGGEILYPWVSRMIMLGLFVTGEIPFKEVYIHGYVLAKDGAKMSKSIGNTISPMKIIEDFGSDALRMGIVNGRVAGINQPFDNSKFTSGRNFANKLWNIARFIEKKFDEKYIPKGNPKPETMADHWILHSLGQNIDNITDDLDNYRFSEAYNRVYHFVWDDVADWYIEASKANLNAELLAYILTSILKLAHPFAPFVTETIWQTLNWTDDELLINQSWPKSLKCDKSKSKDFIEIIKIVGEIRYITTALEVKYPGLYYKKQPFLTENADLIKRLAKLSNCKEVEAGRGMHLTQTKIDCWLDIDLNTSQKYITKLHVNKLSKEATIEHLKNRLDNKSYIKNAPAEVVKQTKDQLNEEQTLLEKIEVELANFESANNN